MSAAITREPSGTSPSVPGLFRKRNCSLRNSFSLVTVTANGHETEFFTPYTPQSRDDLEENDDFLDLIADLDEAQDVHARKRMRN